MYSIHNQNASTAMQKQNVGSMAYQEITLAQSTSVARNSAFVAPQM